MKSDKPLSLYPIGWIILIQVQLFGLSALASQSFMGQWKCRAQLEVSDNREERATQDCPSGQISLSQLDAAHVFFKFQFQCQDLEPWSYSRKYKLVNGQLFSYADPMTDKLVYSGMTNAMDWQASHYSDDRLVHLGPVTYDGDSEIQWQYRTNATSQLDFLFKNLAPFHDVIGIRADCTR